MPDSGVNKFTTSKIQGPGLEGVFMKIILKKDVESVGRAGDLVNVSNGYARNFLIPRGLGTIASSKNMNVLKSEMETAARRTTRGERKRAVHGRAAWGCNLQYIQKSGSAEEIVRLCFHKGYRRCLA